LIPTISCLSKLNLNNKINFFIVGLKNPSKLVSEFAEELFSQNIFLHDLGWLKEEKLEELWSKIDILVYPSLLEGFGLPILEAYSRGIQVVTSEYGAMKEVAGEYAHFANPYDQDSIASAILNAIHNPKTKNQLINYAIKFNWTDTSRRIIKEVHQICSTS
jgi:glycosyltransferase involved in cell wall biosynthesis